MVQQQTISSQATTKRRKRGVKASRIKLEKALISAGFKTQVDLAKHLAELENLDAIPKDLVNKIFRELSVDPSSLERVAAALGVDAYSLYLTTFDATSNQITNNTHNKDKSVKNLSLSFNHLSIVLSALILLWAVNHYLKDIGF